MSFAALAWAAKVRTEKAAEKLILLAYADLHSEKTGHAFPSLKWLEEFSSLNRKTVIAAVERLEATGLLTDTGERAGSTKQIKVYRVNLGTEPKTEQFQKRNRPGLSGKQSQIRDTEPTKEPTSPTKAKPSSETRTRADRPHPLPDDWQPRPFGPSSAESEIVDGWVPERLRIEEIKFRNYWSAVGGSRGAKSDWQRTWANWIIKAAEFDTQRNGGNYGPRPAIASGGLGRTAAAARDIERRLEDLGGARRAVGN